MFLSGLPGVFTPCRFHSVTQADGGEDVWNIENRLREKVVNCRLFLTVSSQKYIYNCCTHFIGHSKLHDHA